jgi:hypothetical protein
MSNLEDIFRTRGPLGPMKLNFMYVFMCACACVYLCVCMYVSPIVSYRWNKSVGNIDRKHQCKLQNHDFNTTYVEGVIPYQNIL